jgi:myo-inositol-1(or 4)-monophosphatase
VSATRPDLPDLARVAELAARGGGEVILGTEAAEAGTPELKGSGDYVTAVDRASEAAIVRLLAEATPGIPVVGEEGGGRSGDQYWLVDPLDGTTNFLHGFPQFAVSVACRHRGRAEVGVVLDPTRGELFTAERGAGTQLDGRRLRVSQRPGLEGALVGTGFPFRENRRWLKPYMAMLERIMEATAGVRRPGAASLDLAYVAAGRFDGYWERDLKPWDMAPGALLVSEAGGKVTDAEGGEDMLAQGSICAGNLDIHPLLLERLKQAQ